MGNPREILHPGTILDQDPRMLLDVMPLAGDVCCHLSTACEAHTARLTLCGVWLTGLQDKGSQDRTG